VGAAWTSRARASADARSVHLRISRVGPDQGWLVVGGYPGKLRPARTGVAAPSAAYLYPPAPKRKTLPRRSGSFAVIRALVGLSGGDDEESGATTLAAQAGVSQPRASQILHHLHELELVDRSGHGRWEPRREALLDRFLAEYPGPGGSEQYYYSLDPPRSM
jgi:hypothetical protein